MADPGVFGYEGPYLADEPVGLKIIAARLDMNPVTLASRRHRGRFPKERAKLSTDVPWWYWQTDIVPWARAVGLLEPQGAGDGATRAE